MKRGEIWTAAGGSGYSGKPRPVVIVQSDRFEGTQSIAVCGFTTTILDADLFRVLIAPSTENGLRLPCMLMVDKLFLDPQTPTRTPHRQIGHRRRSASQ